MPFPWPSLASSSMSLTSPFASGFCFMKGSTLLYLAVSHSASGSQKFIQHAQHVPNHASQTSIGRLGSSPGAAAGRHELAAHLVADGAGVGLDGGIGAQLVAAAYQDAAGPGRGTLHCSAALSSNGKCRLQPPKADLGSTARVAQEVRRWVLGSFMQV